MSEKKVKNKVKKERLDVLLVERGFFNSRENAKRHIMAGIILVDNMPVDKPGTKVYIDSELRIKGKIMPYVGRGGYKLEKALESFNIDLNNSVMMDIGASTGGFTDCALQKGARKVFAVDVGTNQLDWKLRSDCRVVNMEKTNIKEVTLERIGEKVDFISTDISFISVLKIIPAVNLILKDDGNLVILIKPQFEAGKEKVQKGGIVKDSQVHRDVILKVLEKFEESGLYTWGLTYSPIKGGSGNIEFLAWLRKNQCSDINNKSVENVVLLAHKELGVNI